MESNELPLIELRRGDSSEFFYSINVTFDTQIELTDWKAYFQVGSLKPIEYHDISSKSIDISIGNTLTSQLRTGMYTGYLKLVRPSGVMGTLKPILNVKIISEVVNVK